MKRCSCCKRTILFGGKKLGDQLFCSDQCYDTVAAFTAENNIPEEVLDKAVKELHNGRCPECNGAGPVDVHMYHPITSIIIFTFWGRESIISCKSCALKQQKKSLLFAVLFGWWGLPFGLILTPLQIIRNLTEIDSNPSENGPSEALRDHVRIDIGKKTIEKHIVKNPIHR